jgi:hypothetical protein
VSAAYTEGPIDDKPPGPLIVAEHMASVMRRMFKQAGMVAKDASSRVDDDKYGRDEWMKTMTKLFDIAMVGGIDLVQTAVVGPAPYTTRLFNSKKFEVKPADHDRKLTLEPPGLARPGATHAIPSDRIKIQPPTLPAKATEFHFEVNEEGLPSGVYTGKVRVGDGGETADVAIRL